jgi:hypothetical protein
MINILKNSIFKNLVVLIHGPMILLRKNISPKFTFKELNSLNPFINFLSFRLNNKIYSKKQVKNLEKISYLENVVILHNSLKTFTKLPYCKFKTKKKLFVSK